MFFIHLADAALADIPQGIYSLGATGVVLAWFMYKFEPRMRSMEIAIQQSSRAQLVLTLAIAEMLDNKGISEQAKAIIKEIDESVVNKKSL